MIAFSMHKSSEGKVWDCQFNLSDGFDKNSSKDKSYLNDILAELDK